MIAGKFFEIVDPTRSGANGNLSPSTIKQLINNENTCWNQGYTV